MTSNVRGAKGRHAGPAALRRDGTDFDRVYSDRWWGWVALLDPWPLISGDIRFAGWEPIADEELRQVRQQLRVPRATVVATVPVTKRPATVRQEAHAEALMGRERGRWRAASLSVDGSISGLPPGPRKCPSGHRLPHCHREEERGATGLLGRSGDQIGTRHSRRWNAIVGKQNDVHKGMQSSGPHQW